MNYPLISEYVEAIKAAEDNFEQLKHLRPVLGEDGEPVMTSGNFAVVFKMKDEQTGKLHAVKCFLKEQEGRAVAYRQIAEELEFVSSTFLTPIKYLDKELFVDSTNSEDSEFPVLLMDWVEGQTLDKYIREHIDDQYELSLLAYQFSRLAMWLMPQPFAHGDLKPDNILVKEDGTLVLVDYDGMYVPAMKGQKARELGSPDFRHPSRTEEVFDDHIDDFSLASILLSLKAIALQPSLLEEYGASDRLLFSEKDYRNLSESSALGALQPLMQDAELASLYSLYILALSQNNLSQVSFRLFNLSRPDRSQYEEENLSTEVTDEDLANAWTDEFGVKYSADGKRLLSSPADIFNYTIKQGTIVICELAFWENENITSVIMPDSVSFIGRCAFENCRNLSSVIFSNKIQYLSDSVFHGCTSLKSIDIPNSIKVIGENAFAYCIGISSLSLPDSVIEIEYNAFSLCKNLESVYISDSIQKINPQAFHGCSKIHSLVVGAGNKYYDSRNNCNAIIEIKSKTLIIGCSSSVIPNDVTRIGPYAFDWCEGLSSITIPDNILELDRYSFSNCNTLTTIIIPRNVEKISCYSFYGCKNLSSLIVDNDNRIYDSRNDCNAIIETANNTLVLGCSNSTIPSGVIQIGNHAFGGCKSIVSIVLPKTIKKIDNWAFSGCESLATISLPNDLTEIGYGAFSQCRNLKSIIIPSSVTKIANHAFFECKELENVFLPEGVEELGQYAFARCESLTSIHLPDSLAQIGGWAFDNCCRLKSIFVPAGTINKFRVLFPKWCWHLLVEEQR